ncbi:hypothetical protein F5X96DRAFT_690921 [Biscogniauxia mediterranea]|nr:hypothetical protein F5X96DRAFT_690921 [Biscogniauxia mediterranea]
MTSTEQQLALGVKMQPRYHNLQVAFKEPTATTNSPSNTFHDSHDLGAALSMASEKLTELVDFLQLDSAQPDSNSTCTVTDPPISAETPCPHPSPAITFDKLPNEIRNMIWEATLEAEFHDRFVVVDKLDKTVIPFQPTAVSPLLGVNRESRSYALHALPQTVPIRRIDSSVPCPNELPSPDDLPSPSSNKVTPVPDGPACGVLRYSLERDTFIHGPRYTMIREITPEMLSHFMVGLGESSAPKMRREPLYLRYISAPLPSLDEAKHVIGWRPLYPPPPPWCWLISVLSLGPVSEPQTPEEKEREEKFPLLARECLCRRRRRGDPFSFLGLPARRCYCEQQVPADAVEEELPSPFRNCPCRLRRRRRREGVAVAPPPPPPPPPPPTVPRYCYCVSMPDDEPLLAEWLVMMSTVGMPWLRMLQREAMQL